MFRRTLLFIIFLFLGASIVEAHSPYSDLNLESEASLKKALKQKDPLQTWLALRLASSYVKTAKFQEAIDLLKKLKNDPSWDFFKNVRLAQSHVGLNEPDKALELLKNLPPFPDPAINSSQDFYRTLYAEALETEEEALKKLGKNAKKVGIEEKILQLHVTHEEQTPEIPSDLITVDEITGSFLTPAEKCRAYNELGDIFKKHKQELLALTAFSQTVGDRCDVPFLPRALYWKARLQWGLPKPLEALKTYQTLKQKFPDHRLTDDAYEGIWKIYKQLKQEKKAVEAYRAFINNSAGDRRSAFLWDKAYEEYRKKNYVEVIVFLDQIIAKKAGDDEFYPQALYWKGRALDQKSGKTKHRQKSPKNSASTTEAARLYHRIMDEFPYSFYALMAADKLGDKHSPSPLKTPNPAFMPLDDTSRELMTTINALNQMGLSREAQEVLDYFCESQPALIEKFKPVLAQKWMESGDPHHTIAMAFHHYDVGASEGVLPKNDEMAFALYPMAYPKEVEQASKETGLAKHIIEGIMREESLFKKEVRSWAGAIGVMQLMPATARMQAREIGIGGLILEDLTNPKTNILLGASYFSQMLKRFDGQLPFAVMAYNAGPGNVSKWLRRNGHLPLDEFIEAVPLSETRGYVKRVLRSMEVYRALFKES